MRSFALPFPLHVFRQRHTPSSSNNRNWLQLICLYPGTAICLPNPKASIHQRGKTQEWGSSVARWVGSWCTSCVGIWGEPNALLQRGLWTVKSKSHKHTVYEIILNRIECLQPLPLALQQKCWDLQSEQELTFPGAGLLCGRGFSVWLSLHPAALWLSPSQPLFLYGNVHACGTSFFSAVQTLAGRQYGCLFLWAISWLLKWGAPWLFVTANIPRMPGLRHHGPWATETWLPPLFSMPLWPTFKALPMDSLQLNI